MIKKILTCAIIIVFLLVIAGCGDKTLEEKQYNFLEKCAHSEKDEWVYSFCAEYERDEDGNFSLISGYYFNGYDLVGKNNSDTFSIQTINEVTGEIIDSVEAPYHSFLTGSQSGDEITKIDEYFNGNNFSEKTLNNDLEDLNLKIVDSKLLFKLYNEAISSPETEIGNFTNIPMVSTIKKSTKSGELRLGYLIEYGHIVVVKIDFVDKNGKFLSDLVKDNLASKAQIKDYENLTKLQDFIVKNQKIEIGEKYEWDCFTEEELVSLINEVTEYK